jgi:crotonobetainyl-CoA:carnitine CoA-transferase CaiB-like acyl-CoA transferase
MKVSDYCYEHLQATGGLADIKLPDGERAGQTVQTTLLPFTMAGQRLKVRLAPPALGEHTREIPSGLGYGASEIASLHGQNVVH